MRYKVNLYYGNKSVIVRKKESVPKTAISALAKYDKDYFLNIFNILTL